MRVFIADDSQVVVERLADLLREVSGVQLIGQAADGREAIHSILELNPDVVILDLQMPGASGLEVLRAVRGTCPSVCVLICTNYPYAKYREECIAAGANFFLDKSLEFERIPTIFRDLIKREAEASSVAHGSQDNPALFREQ